MLSDRSISSGPSPLCIAPERLAEQLDYTLGEPAEAAAEQRRQGGCVLDERRLEDQCEVVVEESVSDER